MYRLIVYTQFNSFMGLFIARPLLHAIAQNSIEFASLSFILVNSLVARARAFSFSHIPVHTYVVYSLIHRYDGVRTLLDTKPDENKFAIVVFFFFLLNVQRRGTTAAV